MAGLLSSSSPTFSQLEDASQFGLAFSQAGSSRPSACFQSPSAYTSSACKCQALRSLKTTYSSSLPFHSKKAKFIKQRESAFRRIRASASSEGNRERAGSNSEGSSGDSSLNGSSGVSPFQPESAAGQFLLQLASSHPHLVQAAAEQQLELLAQSGPKSEETSGNLSGSELVLYRRMADVRESERRRAIEEVIYALIVQKFIEAGTPLLPCLPFVAMDESSGLAAGLMLRSVGVAAGGEKGLEGVHSAEALEMVKEHLALILGGRTTFGSNWQDEHVLVGTSKIRLGQVYAASIMYGYFLRRVDQRFQLEKSINLLPSFFGGETGSGGSSDGGVGQTAGGARTVEWEVAREEATEEKEASVKGKSLKSYVMSFDPASLQKTATIRSRESVRVVEKQTEALFGKPDIVLSEDGGAPTLKDEAVHVSVSALRRLILEAVAFGGFLWDVESFVDNRYSFAKQS